MRISDWSSDVCSSDLSLQLARLVHGDLLFDQARLGHRNPSLRAPARLFEGTGVWRCRVNKSRKAEIDEKAGQPVIGAMIRSAEGGAVRGSRRPLRGLITLRRFLNAIKDLDRMITHHNSRH